MLWRMCYDDLLPVHELNRCHHEVAVRPNSMSKDGGVAVSVVALAVVLATRDGGAIHRMGMLGRSSIRNRCNNIQRDER